MVNHLLYRLESKTSYNFLHLYKTVQLNVTGIIPMDINFLKVLKYVPLYFWYTSSRSLSREEKVRLRKVEGVAKLVDDITS